MHNFKRWEDLTFTDDFMFSQVMKNKEICKEVIETLLHIKVGKLEYKSFENISLVHLVN